MRAWRHKRAKYVGRRVSGGGGQGMGAGRGVADGGGVGRGSAGLQLCDFSKFYFLSLLGSSEDELQSCLGVSLS